MDLVSPCRAGNDTACHPHPTRACLAPLPSHKFRRRRNETSLKGVGPLIHSWRGFGDFPPSLAPFPSIMNLLYHLFAVDFSEATWHHPYLGTFLVRVLTKGTWGPRPCTLTCHWPCCELTRASGDREERYGSGHWGACAPRQGCSATSPPKRATAGETITFADNMILESILVLNLRAGIIEDRRTPGLYDVQGTSAAPA